MVNKFSCSGVVFVFVSILPIFFSYYSFVMKFKSRIVFTMCKYDVKISVVMSTAFDKKVACFLFNLELTYIPD